MKKILKSKTFWINLISIGAIIYQSKTGFIIPAEAQLMILGIINIIVRKITKEEVVWK